MYYRLMAFNDEKDKVILPGELCRQNSINQGKVIKVKAGVKLITAEITVSSEEDDTVGISHQLVKQLSIPMDCKYQIVVEGDILHIGPVIGLLFNKRGGYLTNDFLRRCFEYTCHYELFRGLLCVFNYDAINFQDNTVEGYYYGDLNNHGPSWKKGVFPLPEAIYRRMSLNSEQMNRIKSNGDIKIFNSYYFNKLSFWKLTSSSEILRPHIPDSRLLRTAADLEDMLQLYGTVYLKPVSGSKASGLIQVEKDENYHFRAIGTEHAVEVEKGNFADNYVRRLLKERPYLVQQAVNSLRIENRKADFRVVMQKDEKGKWHCNAIIGKVGKINGISSNFTRGGEVLSFENTLKKAAALSDRDIFDKKREFIGICAKLCMELDGSGENFGDFGIDAAIDEDLHIWIFEANKEQDFSILKEVYGRGKYLSIKSNPTMCAVGLTPFGVDNVY